MRFLHRPPASEGRSCPCFRVTFRACLLASAAVLAGAGPAGAATIDITGTTTTQQSLSGTDTLTVETTGKLSVGASDPALQINNASTGVVITNLGLIEDTHSGASRAVRIASGGSGAAGTTRTVTLNNAAGATIQTNGDAFQSQVNVATGTITVNNAGLLQSIGTGANNGQAIDLDNIQAGTATIVINNSATGVIRAADADAIRPGNNSTVSNHGLIFGGTASATGNDGVDFQSANTGTVNNFSDGSIIGTRHGITGDRAQTIVNSGIITGQAGSGINLDTVTGTTVVTNNAGGMITGTIPAGAPAGRTATASMSTTWSTSPIRARSARSAPARAARPTRRWRSAAAR